LYYTWFRADEPDGQRLLEAAGEDGLSLPVVITEQGTTLVNPPDAELAATLGLTTTLAEDFYDLVVIGGGPAGLAAAVYGASEGLRTVLIERTATGGQAGQSSRIENYLGFPDGLSGAQLADRARRQAVKFDAELITAQEATALEVRGAARTVKLSDGREVGARSVILATGVSYRQLPADGCDRLTGAGVHYGAALSIATECDGEDVYVIGGANSAGQAAVNLAKYAKSVTRGGPVTLQNLDEAALIVKGPSGTKIMRVGTKLTLVAKGTYRITMVKQAPDDNHLILKVT
jgi:thioredoxin reductase (NADPH)